jgi:hypothetical protein
MFFIETFNATKKYTGFDELSRSKKDLLLNNSPIDSFY